MTAAQELEKIEQVLNGDVNAFEDLLLNNQQNVYNLTLRLTGSEQDALDISQEAFIKAFQSLSNYRSESRFSVWLYRIAYNLCIDFLRKNSRGKTIPLTYEDSENGAQELELPDLRALPEDSLLRKELRQTLSECIDELPEDHREIFAMREIADMSYTEIAQALGISEGTVKSRLARARKKLAQMLIKQGTFADFNRHKDMKEKEGD